MTGWWWVRHGPTHEKSFLGWRDLPADLSDVALLARLDATLPRPALVVSSDLLRARQTADVLGRARSRQPDEPDLREFNFGAWDGQAFHAVSQNDPDLSRAFWEQPGDVAPPDGESWNTVSTRVSKVVNRLSRAHAGQHIVAVAHIGTIMTQIARCQNQTSFSAMSHQIDNLSITQIDVYDDKQVLRRVNETP
ncbi:MAG: histidine phosphatase family protein [Pseudomonadota bacterium]